jgi:hypothetical protein
MANIEMLGGSDFIEVETGHWSLVIGHLSLESDLEPEISSNPTNDQ